MPFRHGFLVWLLTNVSVHARRKELDVETTAEHASLGAEPGARPHGVVVGSEEATERKGGQPVAKHHTTTQLAPQSAAVKPSEPSSEQHATTRLAAHSAAAQPAELSSAQRQEAHGEALRGEARSEARGEAHGEVRGMVSSEAHGEAHGEAHVEVHSEVRSEVRGGARSVHKACRTFFLLEGKPPAKLPDTWAEARERFADICHRDLLLKPENCRRAMEHSFLGFPSDDTDIELSESVCEHLSQGMLKAVAVDRGGDSLAALVVQHVRQRQDSDGSAAAQRTSTDEGNRVIYIVAAIGMILFFAIAYPRGSIRHDSDPAQRDGRPTSQG